MQFPLLPAKDNPAPGLMFRVLAAISAAVGIVMFVLGLIGAVDWSNAAVLPGMLIYFAFIMLWQIRKESEGFAEITETHLFIERKRGSNERYRLDDIADVHLKRAYWGRLPLVELKLRRSLMFAVRKAERGTEIAGIPTVFLKRASVLVEDTEGFAEELRRRLPPGA